MVKSLLTGEQQMSRQRKIYSAEFKAKVALAAIKGQQTINEMAASFGVHPNQVTQWKKQALEAIPDSFSAHRVRASALGRRTQGATLPADRSTQSRVGLVEKKSWTLRLSESAS